MPKEEVPSVSGSQAEKVEAVSGVKLIGTLENFVPSADFDDYLERAENFFELNDIKDDTFKRKLIVHFIGLPALKKLQQLLYPDTHRDVTYETVIEKLKSYFSPKKNRIAQSVEFFKRNQKEFENVADFAVELQALSKHCVFGEYLDKALRDKFIAGLRKSKQEYTNRINAGQYMRRSRSKTRGQDDGKHSQQGSRERRSFSRKSSRNQGRKVITCFGCGKKGHIVRNCWKKRNMNGLASSDDESDLRQTGSESELHHVTNLPLYRKV